MDKLKSIEAFIAAADGGSFSSAAIMLGVSPQQIAKQIQNLEHYLGIRLLNRTTRRQNLTESGRQYLEKCRHILAELEAAEAQVTEALAVPKGKIRISAPYNYGSHTLIPFITQYLREYPSTDIELVLSDRFVNTIEGDFDILFRVGDPELGNSSTLISRKLKPFNLYVCASPEYIARYGQPEHPDELKKHECIGYVFGDGTTDNIWEFRDGQEIIRATMTTRLKVNDTKAKVNAAINGFGITVCAEDMFLEAASQNKLKAVLGSFTIPPKEVSIIYSADRHQPEKIRLFIKSALEYLS